MALMQVLSAATEVACSCSTLYLEPVHVLGEVSPIAHHHCKDATHPFLVLA